MIFKTTSIQKFVTGETKVVLHTDFEALKGEVTLIFTEDCPLDFGVYELGFSRIDTPVETE